MDSFKKKIGEELYKQIIEKLGKDEKVYLKEDLDGAFVPKDEFNKRIEKLKDAETQVESLNEQLKTQKAEYEKQIKDTSKKIADLEPLAQTNTELSEKLKTVQEESAAKVKEYDDKLKAQMEEAEQKIKQTKFSSRVRDFVRSQGAMKDSQLNAVLANVDLEKVADDETLTGLKDQVNALKESDPNFFGETKVISDAPVKPSPSDPNNLSIDDIKNMSADEIVRIGVDKVNAIVTSNGD